MINKLNGIEDHKKSRLKKFIVISFITFSIITVLAFLLFTSCSDGMCNIDYFNVFNIIIVFIIIGLVYCVMIIKDLDKKIDDRLIPEYKDIIDNLDKETINKKDKKNLSLF